MDLIVNQLRDEDKAWDEKGDLFDGDFVKTENEDGTTSYVIKEREPQHHKKRRTLTTCKSYSGTNEYPLDIWFLISEHIEPEDVGRFAGICKMSYAVVQTAKFWFKLYKRYYRKDNSNLPERLKPPCTLRIYGVKTSAVRALYHMYPPFVERQKRISNKIFEVHPHCLRKKLCVLMWHEMKKTQWFYYFKFKETGADVHGAKQKQDLVEILEDVSANPDEGCKILEVACKNFIPVPLVQGLTLSDVTLNLSQGFRHHRLQMSFKSGYYYSVTSEPNNVILLDPVVMWKIFDWWHPSYPQGNNINRLLDRD